MTTHEKVLKAEVFWNAYKLAKNLMKELNEATANLGEEPDLTQDDAIDDLDGIVNHSHDRGYIDGLKFALKLFNQEERSNFLLNEIRIAVDIIENHHVNCDWMAEPDLNAEITETCAEFDEIYGRDFTRLVCHDHDKLREWSKMLKDINTIPDSYTPTCAECSKEYTETYGESATYDLCPDCYEEAVKEGNLNSICE